MSTESTTKPTGPLACRGCGNTDGPFTRTGLCETCADPEAALRSALEDGGHLDGNAQRLMDAYAASVLRASATALRAFPNCDNAADIVDSFARGVTR